MGYVRQSLSRPGIGGNANEVGKVKFWSTLTHFKSQLHPVVGWGEMGHGKLGENTSDISKEAYALDTEWIWNREKEKKGRMCKRKVEN